MPRFKVVFERPVVSKETKEVIVEEPNLGLALVKAARQTEGSWSYVSAEETNKEEK